MPVDAQGSRGDTAFAPNAPIVAALARAQAELTNPEKSLTATIRASHRARAIRPSASCALRGARYRPQVARRA